MIVYIGPLKWPPKLYRNFKLSLLVSVASLNPWGGCSIDSGGCSNPPHRSPQKMSIYRQPISGQKLFFTELFRPKKIFFHRVFLHYFGPGFFAWKLVTPLITLEMSLTVNAGNFIKENLILKCSTTPQLHSFFTPNKKFSYRPCTALKASTLHLSTHLPKWMTSIQLSSINKHRVFF